MRSKIIMLCAAIIALATAYIAEYVFGLIPCKLCLYQRIIYFLSIILTIGVFFQYRIIYLSFASYIGNALLALYHVGIEKKILPDLAGCTSTIHSLDVAQAMKAMLHTIHPPCDEPAFTLWGISMSGWNFLYCTAVAMVSIYLWIRYDCKKIT